MPHERSERREGDHVRVDVNGAARELADGTTLLRLIESVAGTARGSAAVVDGAVIARSDWPSFTVVEGQRIELITAVQGG
jgi:sulfur carrier protein